MNDVILIDDDSDLLFSLIRALKSEGLQSKLHGASSREKAIELIESVSPAVAVIDLSLNDKEGIESGFSLLVEMLRVAPSLRIIVLTGHTDVSYGVRAISLGAANFLEKPPDILHLKALIEDGLKQYSLRTELLALKEKESSSLEKIIVGASKAAVRLREEVIFAAATPQPALLTGETGTGKGLCAKAIHLLSARAANPFVTYQPSFGGGDLIRSDLFGHVKGAFTGATEDRGGLFKRADKGSLFLDEIDELPLETQVSLLGVLQNKRASALGSDSSYSSDFRLIAATNEDPLRALEKGKLRSDFYHRIGHLKIQVPTLRERLEDLPILSSHALELLAERENLFGLYLSDEALEKLTRYDWPGNIRELLAAVEGGAYRAAYGGRRRIEATDFSIGRDLPASSNGSFHDRVETFKQNLIRDALDRSGGNQVQAAKELGLDRSTMRRFLARRGDFAKS